MTLAASQPSLRAHSRPTTGPRVAPAGPPRVSTTSRWSPGRLLEWVRTLTQGLRPGRRQAPIRLIALDLDGTLLDSKKRISGRTVRALKALPEQGIRVVLASARPPRSCKAIYNGLGLDTWQINYNGALVWDPRTARSVFHWPMEGDLVYEQVKLGRELVPDVQVAVEIVDRWYTDRHDPYRTTVTGRMFKPDVVAPIRQWARLSATKLMFLSEPKKVARIRNALRDQYGHRVKVVHADPDLVQVMSNEAGKDVALRHVAAHYGIPIEQTMGIGDALNDVDMLRATGVSVCVANGCDEAKAISHWIAPSNDEDGVYETVCRYIPGLREKADPQR